MVRLAVFSACALLVVTQAHSACNYFSDRSVVFEDNTLPICEEILDSIGVLSTDALIWYAAEAKFEGPTENYWEEWAIKPEDTPLLTQNLEKNYFGLVFGCQKSSETKRAKWTQKSGSVVMA